MFTECFAAAIFSYFCYLLLKFIHKLRQVSTIKYRPNLNFLLGHLASFKNNFESKYESDISERMVSFVENFFDGFRDEDLTILWLSWCPYIVLTNGRAVEAVLSSNAILQKSIEYDYLVPWIGRGLLTSDPTKWKERRKLLTPAFNRQSLRDFLEVINKHSYLLMDSIKRGTGSEINLFNLIPSTTFDVICESVIGVSVEESKSDYINAILFITEATFNRMFKIRYWFDFIFYRTEYGKRYKEAIDLVHSLSLSVVKKRIKERLNQLKTAKYDKSTGGVKRRKDILLDILVDKYVRLMNSSEFSIEDICEEVDTFIFEGFETTAASICWTLHLLGNNEQVQNKVYEEILNVFGDDTSRFVTFEDLNNLKYLECCIKEALRLYPPVPYFARRTIEDVQICGHHIPKDMTLIIFPYAIHRDPKVFTKPNDFIPERFVQNNRIRYTHSYIPFSVGARNCVGQRFAMNEIKTIIVNILRNFSVKSVSPTNYIPVSICLITRTKTPLSVIFVNRVSL